MEGPEQADLDRVLGSTMQPWFCMAMPLSLDCSKIQFHIVLSFLWDQELPVPVGAGVAGCYLTAMM